jgi:dimethylaniline monooxygenase (N-oxide forming)
MPQRVAIVGAGASGLPAIRHALLYGVQPVAFEMTDDIGGLWRFKPEETDASSVMKTTVINTSKEMTAYSDFPPPDDYANFMHNRQMLKYLKLYAEKFCLTQYVRFRHIVENVERSADYKRTGRWTVTFLNAEGKRNAEEFDAVLLCTGHHTEPYWPSKWPGQDVYKGRVTHAHSYKDHRGYEDKTVVVVGIGNSGGDISVELSRIAHQVFVATRRGTWVYNRVIEYGMPYDVVLFCRYISFLKQIIPLKILEVFVQRRLHKRFDHAKYGLKPDHGVLGAHPTVNDELPNRLASGTIVVKPNIRSFTERGVIFEDNTSVQNVDEVIMSTGYVFDFPLAEGGKLIPVAENNVTLYQYMYPPETADHNTLAVIGLIQPLGSIMPISEMQTRLFFDVLTGHATLPNKSQMESDIAQKKRQMAERYVHSRRHTIQVDYDTYMDELANLMGCHPYPWAYCLSDPLLAYRLLFGPNAPYTYRLRGPHAWDGARDAILTINKRVCKGMCPREVLPPTDVRKSVDSLLIWAISTATIFCVLSFIFYVFP